MQRIKCTKSYQIKCTKAVGNVKTEVQKQNWKLDALEQYSRRENVKIVGTDEKVGEDTTAIVVQVAESIGLNIKPEDISVSHRLSWGK